LSTERKEFINIAISAAASILTFVIDEEDMRRCLVGTPLYVHTMIAVAAVFLMKVVSEWNAMGFNVNPDFVWELLNQMVSLLKRTVTSERHLLHHIAAGLEKMMAKSKRYMALHTPAVHVNRSQDGTGVNERRDAPVHGVTATPASHDPPEGHEWTTPYEQPSSFPDGFREGADFNEMMLNDGFIYEAFGSDMGDGMYNLLTNQFAS
jgi:hypothetical protein